MRSIGPTGAALRSLAVPGWGHLALGRRRLGWALLAATATLICAGVVVVAVLGPTEVAARLADPRVLTAVLVVNLAIGIFRLWPAIHAWSTAGGSGMIGVVVIAALVLSPHAAFGYVGIEAKQTLERVFATAATTTTTTTTVAPTTTTALGIASSSASTTTSTPTTVPVTPTTTVPVDERMTILLLGGDAGPGRSGLRTDSVIVATVQVATGASAVFSLPRNWGGLPLADGSTVPNRILNEVYEWARRMPDRFEGPDPGATALVEVAEQITGLDIDYYALVDLTGFADVIDAIGGVTIDIPRAVYGPSYDPSTGGYTMIRIPSGVQDLDGREALAYVRERYQSSDYDRMDRQRCLLAAVAAGADTVSLLRGIRGILAATAEHVTTDVPLEQVPVLIRVAGRVDTSRMQVVGFDNTWRRGWDAEGHAIPDVERIGAAVAEAIAHPDRTDAAFDLAGEACG